MQGRDAAVLFLFHVIPIRRHPAYVHLIYTAYINLFISFSLLYLLILRIFPQNPFVSANAESPRERHSSFASALSCLSFMLSAQTSRVASFSQACSSSERCGAIFS